MVAILNVDVKRFTGTGGPTGSDAIGWSANDLGNVFFDGRPMDGISGGVGNPTTQRPVSPIGDNPFTFTDANADWTIEASPQSRQPVYLKLTDTEYVATGNGVRIHNGGIAPMDFTADVGVTVTPAAALSLAPGDTAEIECLGRNKFWVDVPRRSQVHTGAPVSDGIVPVISLAGTVFSLDYQGSWLGDIESYQAQWTRNGTVLAGDTAFTRGKVAGDDGGTVRCWVKATDKLLRQSGGSALSNSIVVPSVAVAPTNTRTARILLAGSVVPGASVPVGGTVIADVGDWTGTPTYAVTWFNPPAGGGAAANRGTVTVVPYTYVTQTGDQNETIYFQTVATNGSGAGTVTSAPLSVVPAGAAGGGGGTVPSGTALTPRAALDYDVAGAGGPTIMSEALPKGLYNRANADWARYPR